MRINEKLIDEKLIHYLEDLSCISLGSEERVRICSDLENILAGMVLLTNLDTRNVPSQVSYCDFKTALRMDDLRPSFPREEILKNAPDANGESFVVPKVVE